VIAGVGSVRDRSGEKSPGQCMQTNRPHLTHEVGKICFSDFIWTGGGGGGLPRGERGVGRGERLHACDTGGGILVTERILIEAARITEEGDRKSREKRLCSNL